ncbi:MAG: alginate O-acetyltransferase [Clostridium sp.]
MSRIKNVNGKKDRTKKWMVTAFFALLLGPNLVVPFVTNADSYEQTERLEKRKLAEFPTFSASDFTEYPKKMDQYINDHAAFRNSFLSLNSSLNLKLFGYADGEDVLKGKDGWYFFTGGASIPDALGTNRFSEGDLNYINSCIQKTADYFRSQGIEFLVVLPPNKEDVYREYLPAGYDRVSDVLKGEELSAYIQTHSDVPVVDPREYLKTNKDYTWYFKTDTHWNDAAGFVTSQMIIDALGGTPTSIDDVTVTYRPCKAGDLANLFHMPESLAQDTSPVIEGYLSNTQTSLTDPLGNGGIVYAETTNAPDPRHIAFYRDSFGTAISNILPKYFEHVDFYHWQSFDASMLAERRPDVVVYEIVEREEGRIPDDMHALAPEAFDNK